MAITLISTVTVGAGGQASIDFTSIPGTYTDLYLVVSFRTTDTGGTWTNADFKVNGVTTNLSSRFLYGNGATAAASSGSQNSAFGNSGLSTSNTFGSCSFYISNYSGSLAKPISSDQVTENNSSTSLTLIQSGLWNSSAAITSMTYTPVSGNMAQYSTATLYGITKGSSGGVTVA